MAMLFGGSLAAHAQGVSLQQYYANNVGRPLAGVSVQVCNHVTSPPNNPCTTTLSTLYANVELTGSPLTNPTKTDALGNLLVYVVSGTYDLTVSGNGIVTKTFTVTTGGSGSGGDQTLAAPTGIQVTNTPTVLTWAMPTGWSAGSLLLGNGANSVTNLGIGANSYVLTSNGVTAVWAADGSATKTCQILIGDDNSGIPLTTGNIEPQLSQCYNALSGTMVSVVLMDNAGASTLQLGYRHNGSTTAITGVLTPGTVSGITDKVACATVGGVSITIEGNTVACGTLTATTLAQGDYLETIGGAADGTTTRVSAALTFNTIGGGGGSGGGLADPGSNGIVVRTALNLTVARALAGTTNYITITNADGTAGNPTINVGANVADLSIADAWAGKQSFNAGALIAAGQGLAFTEGSAPAAVSGQDICYGDTAHTIKCSLNGGGYQSVLIGTVVPANGGTGLTSLTANCVLVGAGTSSVHLICPVMNGDVLTDNGPGSDPSFQPGPSSMSTALSAITAATTASTISNGDNNIRFNWHLTTSSGSGFVIGESSASTATGSILFRATTAASSTALPFQADNNGNGVKMSAVGALTSLGTGGLDYGGIINFPSACSNQFARQIGPTNAACASVNLSSDVTNHLGIVNGGTGQIAAPVKRMEINFAVCDDSSGTPVIGSSWARASSGSFTPGCKIDGVNGTVQGVLQAAHSNAAYATIVLPADFATFNSAYLMFSTGDTTSGHTGIFNVATACVQPNAGNADTPAFNSANAFTTVTIGMSAVTNAVYATSAGSVTSTGCAAGYVAHIQLSRSASDTITDTAIQLTGSLVLAYNGAYN